VNKKVFRRSPVEILMRKLEEEWSPATAQGALPSTTSMETLASKKTQIPFAVLNTSQRFFFSAARETKSFDGEGKYAKEKRGPEYKRRRNITVSHNLVVSLFLLALPDCVLVLRGIDTSVAVGIRHASGRGVGQVQAERSERKDADASVHGSAFASRAGCANSVLGGLLKNLSTGAGLEADQIAGEHICGVSVWKPQKGYVCIVAKNESKAAIKRYVLSATNKPKKIDNELKSRHKSLVTSTVAGPTRGGGARHQNINPFSNSKSRFAAAVAVSSNG
jgi:hypothetical protein